MLYNHRNNFRKKEEKSRIFYYISFLSLFLLLAFVASSDLSSHVWTQHLHRALQAAGSVGVRVYRPVAEGVGNLYDRFWDAPARVVALQGRVEALQDLEEQARVLERHNQELRNLLDLPRWVGWSCITARVLNYDQDTLSAYALVDKGEKHGLEKGFAVFSQEGLIGRVDTVTAEHARIVLLHARDFRVPVAGEKSTVRAVLGGDARPFMRIVHRDQSSSFEEGERLLTVQDAPWLPEGIPVAVFCAGENGASGRIVSCLESFQAHFVRILVPSKELREQPLPGLESFKKTKNK